MIRKKFLMVVAVFALCFVAADTASACKFLDSICCRYRRPCVSTLPCAVTTNCCLPKVCTPAGTGTLHLNEGTLSIVPSEKPADSATPIPSIHAAPKAESPKEPELTPPAPTISDEPKAEPPKEPEATPALPMIPEEPKAEEPKAEPPMIPEEPKAEPSKEPESHWIPEEPKAEPPKEPESQWIPEEPKAEPSKEPESQPLIPEEPKAEPPKSEPATDAFGNPIEEPAKEPAEEKKEEKKDPFGKNDMKEYRLWTDASGEYQVEAKFVGIVDGQVRLLKTNGRYVRIEMNQLCQDDQRLVKRIETIASNW